MVCIDSVLGQLLGSITAVIEVYHGIRQSSHIYYSYEVTDPTKGSHAVSDYIHSVNLGLDRAQSSLLNHILGTY